MKGKDEGGKGKGGCNCKSSQRLYDKSVCNWTNKQSWLSVTYSTVHLSFLHWSLGDISRCKVKRPKPKKAMAAFPIAAHSASSFSIYSAHVFSDVCKRRACPHYLLWCCLHSLCFPSVAYRGESTAPCNRRGTCVSAAFWSTNIQRLWYIDVCRAHFCTGSLGLRQSSLELGFSFLIETTERVFEKKRETKNTSKGRQRAVFRLCICFFEECFCVSAGAVLSQFLGCDLLLSLVRVHWHCQQWHSRHSSSGSQWVSQSSEETIDDSTAY